MCQGQRIKLGNTPSNAVESYNAASILNVVVESQEDAVSDTDPQLFEGGSSVKVIASLPTLKSLVLFPILLALFLIVVWVISCLGFELFFFVTTIKLLVVASFMKYVAFVWPLYVWFGKSLWKPPDKSRGRFFCSILFGAI